MAIEIWIPSCKRVRVYEREWNGGKIIQRTVSTQACHETSADKSSKHTEFWEGVITLDGLELAAMLGFSVSLAG